MSSISLHNSCSRSLDDVIILVLTRRCCAVSKKAVRGGWENRRSLASLLWESNPSTAQASEFILVETVESLRTFLAETSTSLSEQAVASWHARKAK